MNQLSFEDVKELSAMNYYNNRKRELMIISNHNNAKYKVKTLKGLYLILLSKFWGHYIFEQIKIKNGSFQVSV